MDRQGILFTLTSKGAEFHGCLQGKDFEFFKEMQPAVTEFLVVLSLCRFVQAGGKVELDERYGMSLRFLAGKNTPEGKVLSGARSHVLRYLRSKWCSTDWCRGSLGSGTGA